MTSLSHPAQAVVTLFEGPLAGVRFADVDAAGLSKLAADVASAAAELEQQEAKLVELRASLAQRQETLLALAQQALAYARIYAEGDDALLARLNEIALPRASKPRKQAATRSAPEAEAAAPQAAEAVEGAASAAPSSSDEQLAAEDEAPLKTKPSYARPKVKRRLGRAAAEGDSA